VLLLHARGILSWKNKKMSTTDMSSQEKLRVTFIGKQVRITVSDGRVVKGSLECLDKNKNVILGDTVQIEPDNTESLLGFVMLPGAHIVKVELSTAPTPTERDLTEATSDLNAI